MGAGAARDRALGRAADHRDHARTADVRQLRGIEADTAGGAEYDHSAADQAAAGGDGMERGHQRNADRGAGFKRSAGRQEHGLGRGQGDAVSGGAVRPFPLAVVQPHALADARRVDSGAGRVDDAGAIAVRHDLGKIPAAAR